jgi:hypothetical protein
MTSVMTSSAQSTGSSTAWQERLEGMLTSSRDFLPHHPYLGSKAWRAELTETQNVVVRHISTLRYFRCSQTAGVSNQKVIIASHPCESHADISLKGAVLHGLAKLSSTASATLPDTGTMADT